MLLDRGNKDGASVCPGSIQAREKTDIGEVVRPKAGIMISTFKGSRRHKGSLTNPAGVGKEGPGGSFRGVDSGSCVKIGQGKKQRQQEHEEQRQGVKGLSTGSSG